MPSFFRNSPEVSSPACELPSRTTASSPGSISSASKEINPLNPKGLKPCCACPETKQARDDCFLKAPAGEGEIQCKEFLEAHKACMRGYGFKV
ncbi:uncharacterized protein L203_105626 [Cryptococcus depauperatus CBS 7841]|uniref:Cytochrome c oxidase assembly protein subunit 17 n=1 Tax=Cryptococcus depauperatus CBS 7841 TaxID=1295531 RepID=A0AAJ8M3C1_9TREE